VLTHIRLCLILGLWFTTNASFALKCPPVALIKAVSFVKTHQEEIDASLWYLLSEPFSFDNSTWNVSFGKFYDDTKSAYAVLVEGRAFFQQAPLKNKHPKPVWIPHAAVCDYMSEGSEYFIAAVSPPEVR